MKTIHWITILVIIVAGYLLWVLRDKIPFVGKVLSKDVPNSFIRKDKFGNVYWNNINGEYSYTYDYGMVAGIKQKSNYEDFIKAWKS